MTRYFSSHGLIQIIRPHVTLHVTLMNVKFTMETETTESEKRIKRYFDATGILQKFSDFNFGSMLLTEIHISKLGERSNPSGFYDALKIMTLQTCMNNKKNE